MARSLMAARTWSGPEVRMAPGWPARVSLNDRSDHGCNQIYASTAES
jgi:hypothetical protein